MSDNTKGRTMIGTIAPIIPRPMTTSQGQPTVGPPTGGSPTAHPAPAGRTSALAPATYPPASAAVMQVAHPTGSSAIPTVGLRPRSESIPPQLAGEPDAFIGQELCGYTIRRKLAEGGMGVVYEGEHTKIGRLGAIKVLKLEFCRSEDVVERFHQEARAVNAIRHENIVDIYDFGRDPSGRVFFVMEYLEGEPLSTRIRRGALQWSEAFPILEQTLRALKAAHDKGFVHRDLKPDNIWLKYVDHRVQVKLLDFGIAKLVGSESPKEKLTQTGSVIGTPHYMSPEQINGAKDIDQRTDIYALGVIMYEMFTGVTPFVGDTLQAIMTGHLFKEPPKLADIPHNLGVPAPIAEIVDRMLVKDAGARYDNVADVLSDIYDVNGNRTPTKADTLSRSRPTRVPGAVVQLPTTPRPRGKRTLILAIGGLGLAAAVAAVAITQSAKPAPEPKVAQTPTPTPQHIEKSPENKAPVDTPPIDSKVARKDAQGVLRSAIQQVEPAIRIQGSDALGKIKDQPSIDPLTELTQHDADADVRGHSAEALGEIGADARPLLAKLEAAAPPPLKVWYASALARLGDPGARKRLVTYAHDKDLAVSFKAAVTLADVSKPGDQPAIKAIKMLATREQELAAVDPYAGAILLTKAAALHDPVSRKTLYALLENTSEGVRLAAAEGLAKLGDDAGKKVLQGVVDNAASPNRLVAAVAEIPLGEYGGLDVITHALADKQPETRRLAARGLGAIGDRKDETLRALIALTKDQDWAVRIAAAEAVVTIVGIDPVVLAQASVDWTKSALTSQDWAVRKAAAGVLADIPAKDAMPLLAQAIADKSPDVRLAASKSAGKIKTPEAATQVAGAVALETNPQVKEQQVKALGEIGQIGGPAAHAALAKISEEPGRIGVFAAGSLIAVGDLAGKAKLELAVAAPQTELRLAAVEAATSAHNAIVVPTLKIGLGDKIFTVRFAAAEGLADYMDEKAAAIPVLTDALKSKDDDVISRAVAALTRLGEQIKDKAQSPEQLLSSDDPRRRLAAVAAVRVMAPAESVPLLRRLVADQDDDVRHAGVDAIEAVVSKDKDQAIKLYKPLVNDADPFVRSKAAGQLARLVETPAAPVTAAVPAPAPTPAVPPPPPPAGPDPVQTALASVTEASTAADAASTEIAGLAKAQDAAIAAATEHDETTIAKVKELAAKAHDQAEAIGAAATKAGAAVKDASDAAGASPTPEAKTLLAEAQKLARHAQELSVAARDNAGKLARAAADYATKWTVDIDLQLEGAKSEIGVGKLKEAAGKLGRIARSLPAGTRNAKLDNTYGQLYAKMALEAQDPGERRKALLRAQASYQHVAKAGAGKLSQDAGTALGEIASQLASPDAQ